MAPAIKTDGKHGVTLPELPGQKFKGTKVPTAEAIDPLTRTLLKEVDAPNKDGKLLPGSFGEVHFRVGIYAQKVTISAQRHVFRRGGSPPAVVGNDGKVHLRPITIGKVLWHYLEILGGVSSDLRPILRGRSKGPQAPAKPGRPAVMKEAADPGAQSPRQRVVAGCVVGPTGTIARRAGDR